MAVLRLRERYPGWINRIQGRYAVLNGQRDAAHETNLFVARRILEACGIGLVFPLLLTAVDPQPLYATAGLALGGVWLPWSVHRLERRVQHRRREILLELPELLHRLTLLLEAGETLPQALARCDLFGDARHRGALWRELAWAVQQLKHGESFARALEQWAKRCAVQEVTVFVSLLLIHHRRGGGELALSLRGMGRELWEKRKSIIRSMGEEASSKLVFPMVVIFLLIMVIVAYPAVNMIE